jgi:hypothetical protein
LTATTYTRYSYVYIFIEALSIGIGWQGEYKQSGELAAVQQDISSGTTSSPETSSMRTFRISIEKIRGDVREMGDPEFETAGSGSIIFKFTCSSVTSLIYLLDYFSGPIIQRRLLDMTMAIEEMIDDLVTLQVYVPSKVYEETIKTLGMTTFLYLYHFCLILWKEIIVANDNQIKIVVILQYKDFIFQKRECLRNET